MPDHEETPNSAVDAAVSAARAILDETWRVVSETPYASRELGRTVDRLPDIGLDAVSRRTRDGKEILARIARVDTDLLPGDLAITLAASHTMAARWAREEDWYWLAFDPMGVGFFSMFAPAAYSGGFLLNIVHEALEKVTIGDEVTIDRYLALIDEYGRLVRQLGERTAGQADRGIIMPAAQLTRATPLFRGLKGVARGVLRAVAERSPELSHLGLVETRITAEVDPAFDELVQILESTTYADRAPDVVGMAHYPGGEEVYAELVRIHTTLDLSPAEVHDRGHARMARIREDMRALVAQVGFEGTPLEYLAYLADDPAWRATTPEEITVFFDRYIDRFAPEVDTYFGSRPRAGYGVVPLPAASAGTMTFGYYSPPQPDRDRGLYLFNAANLSRAALPMVAALNYHELVPGHHFQMATQREATQFHPIRRHAPVNAFDEGWAEYAARFAGEIGMYREPEERFGRLVMEAFLTSRLVVDTGMNAHGWTLEQAREYMRENAFMDTAEIDSETLRYSCDIPAQALAYKLGDDFLYELREELRVTLGDDFSLVGFHDAVLRGSGLPLPLVAAHVRQELTRAHPNEKAGTEGRRRFVRDSAAHVTRAERGGGR
ncbi:DUF885 domain-containing protein [Streptomyces sp. NPDC050509]|uniref:DUF885 domain-containing protein n=1 Tax=Streptomyces sp. NPDC050509 TaxID=3365620 RepID=UPI003788C922